MPIPDFDNTLTGRYIRTIENPDSLGWNPKKRIWEAPKQRGTDLNNRGMGVDIIYNEDAAKVVKNRPTKYLTEQEERDLRNDHIDYSYGVIDRHLPTHSGLTPERQAMAAGVIYRGDGKKLQSVNNPLGRAYNVGTDAEFEQAITNFYNKAGLKTRARNHQQFFHNERMQNLMSGIVEAAINSAKDASDFHDAYIKAEGGSLNSPKLWDDLSMTERAEMMRVAVNNGITDLPTIRQKYNEFAKGGLKRDYNTWKKLIHDYKGIDVNNDKTYDYLSYYNNHTDEAWDMLNNAPDAHFYDTYKTVYHPTFSDESIYSGRYDLLHNSRGVVGGKWLENPNRFIPSPSKRNIDSIRETANYISVAEPNGLQIRDEYGRWPIINGTVFGGVLPQVDISPKVYSNGGSIHIKPENRGKFTALKERTGHSATWFKQHGTPSQRKMATFALNARKWKHPDGGPLVINNIPDDYTYYVGSLPAVTVSAPALPAYQDRFTGQWYGIGPGGRKVNKPANFDPSGARVYTSPEAFERARLNRAYADDLNHYSEFGDMVRKGATALTLAPMAGPLVEAATAIAPTFAPGSAFWTNPITKQFVASTIGGELANAGSKHLTGKTLDERNAASFEYLTGKNPKDVWYGNLITGALNPGYLLSPNPLMTEAGDIISTATNIAKIASPKYRSLHAYNTINPKGYGNPFVRGKAWLWDMIEDNPVDLKRPLFYQKAVAENNGIRPEEGFLGTGDYLPLSVTNRGQISDEARLDAWAIHNNLEPQYGTYIKTGDRTYSYNIPKLMEKSNGTLQAPNLPKKDKIGGQGMHDFVTGAGGGLTDFTLLGEDAHGNALISIGDLWDVNPFKRIGDELSHRLFPKWDGSKVFTKGTRLYDLGEERSSNMLKYIGDKMRKNANEPLLGILKPLDRKMKDFEVGTITGGKPFMMSTEIPVHKEFSPYAFTIDGSEMKGQLISYPFGYNPDYFVDKAAIRGYNNFKFDTNKVINYLNKVK